MTLEPIVAALEQFYGAPPTPSPRGAWEMILWENVAYLVDDTRRAAAFNVLRDRPGLAPEAILAAPDEELLAATRFGIMPEVQVEKLRRCAAIMLHDCKGDLTAERLGDLRAAEKLLRRFPGVGRPGAERILLICGIHPLPALDSNGLRVLQRLGYAAETGSYVNDYRAAQNAIERQIPETFDSRITMHQLLRRHGQEICRRSNPRCGECPLADDCDYAAAHGRM